MATGDRARSGAGWQGLCARAAERLGEVEATTKGSPPGNQEWSETSAMFCQENQNQYYLTITLYIGKHGRTRREDDGVAGILEQNPGKVA